MARPYRKPGTRLITGIDELDQKLSKLKIGTANKIARPALTKAARLLLKKIKQAVPSQYKDAKRAMGMVVDAKGGKSKNQQRAKIGAAVGKGAKSTALRSGRSSGGVGISGKNIHWFVMGTDQRKQDTTGKPTGQMPAVLLGVVKNTATATRNEVAVIITQEVKNRLEALAKNS